MTTEAAIAVLDRQVYGMAQADALLRLSPGTARRWLEGYTRSGKFHEPVIRPEPTGSELVTWGEFIEAGLLSAYRHKSVPMQRMRPVIKLLRQETGIPYPLAHFKPLVANRELVAEVQDEVGLERRMQLVVIRNGQALLAFEAKQFVDKIEWQNSAGAGRLFPVGKGSPVVIDPELRFGEPSVRGISTANLAELFEAGEPADVLTETYGLTRGELDDAIRYELQRRPAAA